MKSHQGKEIESVHDVISKDVRKRTQSQNHQVMNH